MLDPILSATIAAGEESEEITVAIGRPLGFNASAPCTVLAKNDADGDESWGVLYQCQAHDDARWIKPTSDMIKVVAGTSDCCVSLFRDESKPWESAP